jgi:hypothetical protein
MGGGASRAAGPAVAEGGVGTGAGTRRPSSSSSASLSARVQRVLASSFGLAADESDGDSDDERERDRARQKRRVAVRQQREERPPSGRSEVSNADEKSQEKTLVLGVVAVKEGERNASLTADALALMTRHRSSLAAKNAWLGKRAQAKQAVKASSRGGDEDAKQTQQEGTAGTAETASSRGGDDDDGASSAPSESSSRRGQDEVAEAAREAEEAARQAAEEAKAAAERAAAEQAAREAAERAAAATEEERAAALAAAADAVQQAEAALLQNDLAAARQQHTFGVEALKTVGLHDSDAGAALALIWERAAETQKRWADAMVDGDGALQEARARFSARDFHGAREAVLRAQEAYPRAHPEEGAAALTEKLGPLLVPLEEAEAAEEAVLVELDAVLAQMDAKLKSLKAEKNIDNARALAADAEETRLVAFELLDRPGGLGERAGAGEGGGGRERGCVDWGGASGGGWASVHGDRGRVCACKHACASELTRAHTHTHRIGHGKRGNTAPGAVQRPAAGTLPTQYPNSKPLQTLTVRTNSLYQE